MNQRLDRAFRVGWGISVARCAFLQPRISTRTAASTTLTGGKKAWLAPRLPFAIVPRVQSSRAQIYLSVTALDAEPPKLLCTVMYFGFVGHDQIALKLPPPLLVKVPINAPLAVT